MAEGKQGRKTYTTNVYKTSIDNVSFLGNPHVDNKLPHCWLWVMRYGVTANACT